MCQSSKTCSLAGSEAMGPGRFKPGGVSPVQTLLARSLPVPVPAPRLQHSFSDTSSQRTD